MDRPKTIRWFLILFMVSLGTAIAPMIQTFIVAPESYSRTAMAVSGLVLLGLYAGLGYKIYMGRDWARFFLAVTGVLGSLLMLTNFGLPSSPAPISSLQWVRTAIFLPCIVLLYLKSSNDWFEAHRDSLSDRKRSAIIFALAGLFLMSISGRLAKAFAGSQWLPAISLLTLVGVVILFVGLYKAFTKPKYFDPLAIPPRQP